VEAEDGVAEEDLGLEPRGPAGDERVRDARELRERGDGRARGRDGRVVGAGRRRVAPRPQPGAVEARGARRVGRGRGRGRRGRVALGRGRRGARRGGRGRGGRARRRRRPRVAEPREPGRRRLVAGPAEHERAPVADVEADGAHAEPVERVDARGRARARRAAGARRAVPGAAAAVGRAPAPQGPVGGDRRRVVAAAAAEDDADAAERAADARRRRARLVVAVAQLAVGARAPGVERAALRRREAVVPAAGDARDALARERRDGLGHLRRAPLGPRGRARGGGRARPRASRRSPSPWPSTGGGAPRRASR